MSRNSDNSSVAAAAPVSAQAESATAPTRLLPGPGGRPILHVEYSVWNSSYRIILTSPEGKRQVWRRGLDSLEDAVLRARYVADLCGYEYRQ